MIAIILLGILLILGGLQRVLPQFATPTLNLLLGVGMIVDGILFLVHL